jgi:hypothetical protein
MLSDPTKEIHCYDLVKRSAFLAEENDSADAGGRTAGVNWLTSMMMEPMAAEPSRVNTSQSIKELHSLGATPPDTLGAGGKARLQFGRVARKIDSWFFRVS